MIGNAFELDIVLTPAQQKIDENPARFKVINAGAGFGKTFYAIYKMIQKLGKRRSTVIYIGPTFSQVKRIAWERLKDQIRRCEKLNKRKFLLRKPNETELSIHTINGSIGYLLGSENADVARGIPSDHDILEEAALQNEEVWSEVLRPRLLHRNGSADFISTPRGFNWFKDIYDYASAGTDPDWAGFHFTMYDNPYLSRDEIEKFKKDCRSESVWRQEGLASFEAGGGRVFEEFSFDQHVIEDAEPPSGAVHFRAVDWGLRDATACLWFCVKDNTIWFYDEYVQSDFPASAQAQIIVKKTGGRRIRATALSHDAFRTDPNISGTNVAITFLKNGLENLIRSSTDKSGGIDLVRDLLRSRRIKIMKRCRILIKQIMEYEWSQTASIENKTDPANKDDAVDAMRYGVQLVSLMGDLGEFRKKDQKMYRVGGLIVPLKRNIERGIRVESDCGKVVV